MKIIYVFCRLEIDITLLPIIVTWPVGLYKNITYEIAVETCRLRIFGIGAAAGCQGLVGWDDSKIIDSCVEDVKVRKMDRIIQCYSDYSIGS